MTTAEAETTTFAQSHVLMGMFGSEAAFDAMAADEAKALTSLDSIVDFLTRKALELGQSAGGSALKWASARLLNAMGLGGGQSELQRIAAMLDTILQQQAAIMRQLDVLLEEVKFQHLITRGYPSVQQISSLHDQLRRLSSVRSQPERERESARLQVAILDANSGTMASLKVVSDVLLGRDPLATSDPLIRLFSTRWQALFLERQLRPEVALSTYALKLNEWLHALFIVQYQGLAQLANARIANGDFDSLKQEIEDTVRNMSAQRAMLIEAIPSWVRTLPGSLTDGRWRLVRGPHMHQSHRNISYVLYGGRVPGVASVHNLRFLNRHEPNWNGKPRRVLPNPDGPSNEAWMFEKNGANDAFVLRQRSGGGFVADYRGKMTLRPQGSVLRLVMAPTNGREGWGPEPFAPALGLVGTGSPRYLFWQREGGQDTPVLTGGLGLAAIFEIVPAP